MTDKNNSHTTMASALEGGHTETILTAIVTSSGKIITGGEEGQLCVWSLDGSSVAKHKLEDEADITSFCCSRVNENILFAAAGERIYKFDIRELPKPLETLEFSEDEINQIALDEKENFLAACDDSNNVKVYNLQERKVHRTLRKHSNICATVSFRPKRAWDLVSGGYDHKLIQWDFSRGRAVCIIDMEEICAATQNQGAYVVNPPFIHHIAVNPTGEFLACGTENALIHVFKYTKRTPEFHKSLLGHTKGVSQVHFPTFSSSNLVSGGNDGKILIWDLAGSESQNICNGHSHGELGTNGAVNAGHQAAAPAQHGPPSSPLRPKFTIEHGEKINWITSGAGVNGPYLVIADNTPNATIYPYPQG